MLCVCRLNRCWLRVSQILFNIATVRSWKLFLRAFLLSIFLREGFPEAA